MFLLVRLVKCGPLLVNYRLNPDLSCFLFGQGNCLFCISQCCRQNKFSVDKTAIQSDIAPGVLFQARKTGENSARWWSDFCSVSSLFSECVGGEIEPRQFSARD